DIALGCLGKPFGEDDITAAIAVADAVLRGGAVPSVTPGLRLF
ncbi:MAG: response regulator, partial [Sphingopyxis sp.]|nr:response regulator [Sphingopyxis sp.]